MEIKPGYVEITNYLRNELGISRDYIAEVLDKSIANTVKQAIEQRLDQGGKFDRMLGQAITAMVTNSHHTWNSTSPKDQFEKAVLKEVRAAVGKLLEKELQVDFTIAPKGSDSL